MAAVVRFHFLARREANTVKLSRLPDGRYESGNWRVSEAVARASVGCEIHLHERQAARSWVAGRIGGWRPSAAEPSRVVFRFVRDDTLCREEIGGWGSGSERKYVRAG